MSAREVHIRIYGSYARVYPAMENDLVWFVFYPRSSFKPGGPLGYQKDASYYEKGRLDEHGGLLIMAGFVPRAAELLRHRGHTVRVTDTRQFSEQAFVADDLMLDQVKDQDRAFLEAVAHNPLGQIQVNHQNDVARLVALLTRYYPRAKILVAMATRRRRTHKHLYEMEEILGKGYGEAGKDGRLTFGTFPNLACRDHYMFDILVFPFGLELAGEMVSTDTARIMWRQHRYAFLPRGQNLDTRARFLLEGLCGQVIYRAPDGRARKAEVRVLVAESPWVSPPNAGCALERKRNGYWHNTRRNEMIADLAEGFAASDTERLGKHGLLLEEDGPASLGGKPLRVTVLVESTEHGRELQRRLPGWRLLSSVPAAAEEAKKGTFQSLTEKYGNSLHKVIITAVRAAKTPTLDTDVLIQAGGEDTMMDLRGFPPPSSGRGRPVLLIDVADDFDAAAVAATRRRLRDNAARGWDVECPNKWRAINSGSGRPPG